MLADPNYDESKYCRAVENSERVFSILRGFTRSNSGSFAMLAAIRRASSLGGRSLATLLLEIEITERLAAGIPRDEAGGLLHDRSGRREAATGWGHLCPAASSASSRRPRAVILYSFMPGSRLMHCALIKCAISALETPAMVRPCSPAAVNSFNS